MQMDWRPKKSGSKREPGFATESCSDVPKGGRMSIFQDRMLLQEDRKVHEADATGDHLKLLLKHVKELKAQLCPTDDGLNAWLMDAKVFTGVSFDVVPERSLKPDFLSALPLYEEESPWQMHSRRAQGVSLLESKLQVFENIASVLSKEMAASRQTFVALRGQRAFYTSRYGYKLCMRIYLNGDGRGKGSHISLFLVLLRGDYDALLQWPFAHKVTLMLLSQNNTEHLVNTLQPDPTSPSFQRPVADTNEASGFPKIEKVQPMGHMCPQLLLGVPKSPDTRKP
ncbi:hypothetical protein JD844_004877 [Phrynosoma platyrhinos]|uniref:MATH domain-containing protein n=1 Tax=Phrynosoma platyrhinos TaxID=52577 RepID=A0ABQ7SE29_PHRPL|nr:hypothetical protein JD844_004877 [Phrynosoma platyrhinos]